MLACTVTAATAVNGLHAQNKALGRYAILDLCAINRPDVFKTLHSKMGDFDGHTANSDNSSLFAGSAVLMH
jgi:hypothetical protein